MCRVVDSRSNLRIDQIPQHGQIWRKKQNSEQRPTGMLDLKRPKRASKKAKALQAQDELGRSTDERFRNRIR
jgi:hypothetical protein